MTATWQYGKTAPAYSVGDVVEWKGRFYQCRENIKAGSDGGGSNSPGYSGLWKQVVSEAEPRPLTPSEAQALTARLDPTSLAARLAPAAPVEASGSEREEFVLVPRKAVRQMTMAGCDRLPSVDGVFGVAGALCSNVWDAMVAEGEKLAAASSPPIAWLTSGGDVTRSRAYAVEQSANDSDNYPVALAALSPQPSGETREAVLREVSRMRDIARDWRRPNLAQIEGPNDLKIYGGTIADDVDRWADMLAPVASGGQHSSGEDIKQALTLALELLGQMEPPDARAMSNEFLAMASALAGIQNQEGRDIIAARLKQPFPSVPAEVTFTDVPAQDDDKLRTVVSEVRDWLALLAIADVQDVMQGATAMFDLCDTALKSTAAQEGVTK